MSEFTDILRPEPVDDDPAGSSAKLVDASNTFAIDLWNRLRRGEGNLAFAPASISMALAMTWAGARGATAEQMARVLHVEDIPGVHEAAANLLHRWNDPDRDAYELRVVNRLFGETTCAFEEVYLDLVRVRYGAPLERVDFRNAVEPSRRRINGWVGHQTNDRVPELLSPSAVNALTRLILINAVYFRGTWRSTFPQMLTHPGKFRTMRGESVVALLMGQSKAFPYARTEELELLELPYVGDELSMIILLPHDSDDGMATLEAALTPAAVNRWCADLRSTELDVQMPRFTIDRSSFALASTLSDLGMSDAFGPQADLSGIARLPAAEALHLDECLHETFVNVDEHGTEAAGATAVATIGSAPPRFRVDRAFLFLIRDRRTGAILFMGRVDDPGADVEAWVRQLEAKSE